MNNNEKINQFIETHKQKFTSLERANIIMKMNSGVNHYFQDDIELQDFVNRVSGSDGETGSSDRREFGDFQTNNRLALQSIDHVIRKNPGKRYSILVEPTCGTGSFILAALERIKTLKKIIAVEIYKPYLWTAKERILNYYLEHPSENKPDINIIYANVFNRPFNEVIENHIKGNVLLVGNPPWITNSELGSIGSQNLPTKNNLKSNKGIEAITGKGNFDIAESILMNLLEIFNTTHGTMAFLVKNSVTKNLIYEQKRNQYRIGDIQKFNIDVKKEFNASVDAGLFIAELNSDPEFVCQDFADDSEDYKTEFGWSGGKFVSSIKDYSEAKDIEGTCEFIWRQGVKHDCSPVMELERQNKRYVNALGEAVDLEDDLIYPLLKSSDLKLTKAEASRKHTIITQRKIGDDTDYIESLFPRTYRYLKNHKEYFGRRKSSIYKNKPDYSIFGIGEYSFKPYKVAISGMYKKRNFTLIQPQNDKPVMLDDTCYFIGFDEYDHAEVAVFLLNSEKSQLFLRAISFPDSKRSITKQVLMRISLLSLYKYYSAQPEHRKHEGIRIQSWKSFGKLLESKLEE